MIKNDNINVGMHVFAGMLESGPLKSLKTPAASSVTALCNYIIFSDIVEAAQKFKMPFIIILSRYNNLNKNLNL